MKKLKLMLLLSVLGLITYGQAGQIQQIKIVSFTVKNQLPSVIDNWSNSPGSLLLVAQKPPSTIRVEGMRLVLQIRANGSLVCGNNASNGLLVDNFTTRTFSASELTSVLSGCHDLKDGSYSICAQFFNIDRVAISNEVCKEFTVESPKEVDYAPPTLITPESEKAFSATDMLKPVMFRWTPLVPKPKEPVTYRLRVWQLMQGQNGTAAMRTNQPIIEKEVKDQTQATVSGIYTGPCKPPYLCDFIWNVQALNKDGKPMGRGEGTSEPYTFTIKSGDEKAPVNTLPENNKSFTADAVKGGINFSWEEINPKASGITYRIKVWQLMEGQSSTGAMRTNQPIIEKEVKDQTQTNISGIYTGPCKPPYLCDFVWNVQAINREGHPVGENEGTSEATVFSVREKAAAGRITNTFPEDKKQFPSDEALKPITFRWFPRPHEPEPPASYRIKVWQLMAGQNGTAAMRTNQPIIEKEVKDQTQATVSGIYTGPCKPPYLCDFIWNVQALNKEGHPVGENEGTSEATVFSIKERETTGTIKNTFPEDKKQFTANEALKPITFRWTTLVPKPKEPVTYRIKVWQLMEGQNGKQAMSTNSPLYTLDLDDGTYDALTDGLKVQNLYTGPCKPPYLCDFIWNVQALNKAGNPIGANNGMSEPTTFSVQTQYIIQLDSLKVACTAKPTQYSFSLIVTNQNASVAELVSVGINSSAPPGATIASFTPAVGTTIAPSGGTLTITGIINSSLPLTNVCIKVKIQKQGDPGKNAEDYLCDSVKACKCDACDEKKVKINIQPSNDIVINGNNTITLNQPISITTTPLKLVKSIKAELVYFEFVPESEDCLPCNKDSKTFGNFDNGTHSQQWNYTPPKNFTNPTTMPVTITLPPTVKCCNATVRWCIRWVVTFDDCTVCNKLVCYEKKKEGCAKGIPDNNNK